MLIPQIGLYAGYLFDGQRTDAIDKLPHIVLYILHLEIGIILYQVTDNFFPDRTVLDRLFT